MLGRIGNYFATLREKLKQGKTSSLHDRKKPLERNGEDDKKNEQDFYLSVDPVVIQRIIEQAQQEQKENKDTPVPKESDQEVEDLIDIISSPAGVSLFDEIQTQAITWSQFIDTHLGSVIIGKITNIIRLQNGKKLTQEELALIRQQLAHSKIIRTLFLKIEKYELKIKEEIVPTPEQPDGWQSAFMQFPAVQQQGNEKLKNFRGVLDFYHKYTGIKIKMPRLIYEEAEKESDVQPTMAQKIKSYFHLLKHKYMPRHFARQVSHLSVIPTDSLQPVAEHPEITSYLKAFSEQYLTADSKKKFLELLTNHGALRGVDQETFGRAALYISHKFIQDFTKLRDEAEMQFQQYKVFLAQFGISATVVNAETAAQKDTLFMYLWNKHITKTAETPMTQKKSQALSDNFSQYVPQFVHETMFNIVLRQIQKNPALRQMILTKIPPQSYEARQDIIEKADKKILFEIRHSTKILLSEAIIQLL